ncbi:cytochrome c peroxidase [Pseudomonas sp. CCI3.2]|uniref:cytochrome-c peroxidase n=1 Tax=unclassified Pseudomonas TaxID=196821 RepID=UPI002AC98603|nr:MULTISPECIES: cytochrome c peroxidase [unclassified Pseudomonas]MEB0076410.1 cytochrome c peroxidase [Pseudomonas sp. MH10out]MEB0091241.1 cytochrome c peroxidase [Pseudomonas sp. CCI4.2]MEB0100805.1 cytochrome c peroxidase [Pseudomonas sp. CCI3.2]MEB0128810.1 cytochrome c peroxidase [Pseudomonas sp. CCI2.4]MEB0156963.1 cytochrome c peroxidase [Pseudomonas sp. AH2 (2023)]
MITALALLLGLCRPAISAPLNEPLKPLPDVQVHDSAQVELGRRLFNEKSLSVNNSVACASCHQLQKGGADDVAYSIAANGKPTDVNTPTVLNASLNFRQFWNGRADSLEAQIDEFIRSPMAMGNTWAAVINTLSHTPDYRSAFNHAYPDGLTAANVQNALAAYERTLLTPNSRFDLYLKGDTDILTQDEKYGYQRFKQYGCIACHQGVNIGGNMYQKFGVMNDYMNDRGHPTEADLGRYLVTKDEADRNVFKVPSLRNVALTAPYFHDGSAKTLDEAVAVMFKYQLGRTPSALDKSLIIEFLKTLTGELAGKPL